MSLLLKLSLILTFAFSFTNLQLVTAWSATPAVYQVSIENGLSDSTLWVHCKSGDSDLGLHMISRKGNFSWVFKTSLWRQTLCFCGLTWDYHGRKVFDAFIDKEDFVDKKCGGRHCFWKAIDDGIYLYNIWKHKLIKRYMWDKYIK